MPLFFSDVLGYQKQETVARAEHGAFLAQVRSIVDLICEEALLDGGSRQAATTTSISKAEAHK